MNFVLNNVGKHAFNVGTGIGVSVLDAIKAFEKWELKVDKKEY